ncbi:MAG: thiamine-binding protein [Methanosarcinales archaeon]
MDMGVNRAITSIKIDDRRDKETSIASKIEAVR